MKGIIYVRVSSGEQVQGTSLEFQTEQCTKYCNEKGIEIVQIFTEEGESAKTAERTQLLKALEYCRKNKGKVDAFVVLKVDRFARNTEDHFGVRKILFDYGVTLHSVTEPIGNSPTEKFIETVLAASAEFDNAIRSQRCVDGMSTKFNQGIYPMKPPVGYVCQRTRVQGLKKTQADPPHEEIFPIIQRGLKEYATGLYSQTEIGVMLDKWGLARLRGRETTTQFVDRMMGDYLGFYAGILINPWTHKEIRGLHKPMISREEMYQIQMVRSGKAKKMMARDRLNINFPLRRLISCDDCNSPLTGSSPRGRKIRYSYYHCYKVGCTLYGKNISKEELEEAFMNLLERITPKKEFLDFFKATVMDLWEEKGKSFEDEANCYKKQLDNLDTKRKRIYEMREEGSYTKEEFQERKEEIDNQILATKVSMSEAKIDQFDIEAVLSYAVNFIEKLGRQWFDMSPKLRPRFQKLVFPEGICYKKQKGFGTVKLGLIYELNQLFEVSNPRLVTRAGIEPATISLKGYCSTS